MSWKKWCAACAVLVSLWASEARATTLVSFGNIPQAGDENVLLNTGAIGNPLFGVTNTSGLLVRFTGSETLTAPANGQARIDALDGSFTYLNVDVPGGSFDSLILNLDATMNGTVDFTATTNTGVEVFTDYALGGSGSNFFTFTTLHDQRLLSIALFADIPLEFADAAQFRIGGAQLDTNPPVIPEPATMLLLGTGLAGLVARRYRQQAG